MKHMLTCLFVLCLAAGAAADPGRPVYNDIEIGIAFPQRLGDLDYVHISQYEKPGLGYSIRYEGGDLVKADIYVYDKELAAIPAGHTNDQVRTEAREVKDVLFLMEKHAYYTNVSHVTTGILPKTGDIRFLWDRFEYVQLHDSEYEGVRTSESYVTGMFGKFIKVRYTYKKTSGDAGARGAERFVSGVIALLNDAQPVTAEAILEAITLFRKDPLSDEALKAMALIVTFTDVSDDVIVGLRDTYLPWFKSADEDVGRILLAAFVAGNIRPQLEKKQPKSHGYEGVLQTLETYRVLKERHVTEAIPELERWLKLQSEGTLKAEFERKPEPARPAPGQPSI